MFVCLFVCLSGYHKAVEAIIEPPGSMGRNVSLTCYWWPNVHTTQVFWLRRDDNTSHTHSLMSAILDLTNDVTAPENHTQSIVLNLANKVH